MQSPELPSDMVSAVRTMRVFGYLVIFRLALLVGDLALNAGSTLKLGSTGPVYTIPAAT